MKRSQNRGADREGKGRRASSSGLPWHRIFYRHPYRGAVDLGAELT